MSINQQILGIYSILNTCPKYHRNCKRRHNIITPKIKKKIVGKGYKTATQEDVLNLIALSSCLSRTEFPSPFWSGWTNLQPLLLTMCLCSHHLGARGQGWHLTHRYVTSGLRVVSQRLPNYSVMHMRDELSCPQPTPVLLVQCTPESTGA